MEIKPAQRQQGRQEYFVYPGKVFYLLNICPEFSFAMMQVFTQRLQKLIEMVENLALRSVRGRLAQFLILQTDKGTTASKYIKDKIAQETDTIRDIVGRLLKVFEAVGCIRQEGRKVILLDRTELEAEANS